MGITAKTFRYRAKVLITHALCMCITGRCVALFNTDTSLDVEDVTRRGCVHHALLDINLVCVLALIVNVCHSIRTARIPC